MVKPFKLILTKSEKDKSRIQIPREVDGVLWSECQSNVGGDYGFKGDSVTIKILWATGFVDSSHKWLVGSIENWEDCFDIIHQKINGKNDKGYNNYEENPEQKQIIETWEDQGALVSLCCDGIPQLEMLAEFAVNRVVFNHVGYPIYFTTKPDKAVFDFTAKLILEAKDSSFDFNLLKHNKVPELKQFKKENSWFYLMCEEELYNDPDMIDFTRLEPVLDNGILEPEFEDGYLVKAKLNWTPPEVKSNSYNRSGGGSKGQTEAEILKERQSYVLTELGVSSVLQISEEYGKKLCPIHVDLVMSLATGSSWTNQHYNSQDKSLYNQLYNGNGNSKNAKSVDSSNVETLPTKDEEESVTTKTRLDNQGSDELLYLPRVLQLLNAEDRTFPAEINVEFLRQQDESWLKLFFQFCTGVLVTPQGEKTPFAKGTTRAIHTWVKLRTPDTKGLHTLTEEHLETLTSDKDFKPASEMVI